MEVLTPLLDLAWDVAWKDRDPIGKHPSYSSWHRPDAIERNCVYAVRITHTSRTCRGMAGTIRCLLRIGYGERTWPVKLNYWRYKDMPEYEARNWREMFVHIAAHEFAHLTGYDGNKAGEEMCELTAWDAIDAYRKNQAEIDGKIESALKRVRERAETARQRAEADKAERHSPEAKLARLEAQEKVWLRKLRLALTKMKHIKRSRAAILRWKNREEAALLPIAATPGPR
jgi:hypothetical protein